MPYLAPDNGGPLNVQCTMLVPDVGQVQKIISGLIEYLTHAQSWTDAQDFTADQASQLFASIWDTLTFGPVMVGQILCFTQNNMEYIGRDPSNSPSNLLPCDGRALLTADYPILFGLIGYTFGGAGGNFFLPDIRGRTIVGVGHGTDLSSRTLGESLGEENHTLVGVEMPSHNHGYNGASPTTIPAGVEAVVTSAFVVVESTTLSGADQPHNNMQPTLCLYYYIQVT